MKEKKEGKKEIVIIDRGSNPDAIIGPTGICCAGPYMPVRG